MNLAWMYNYYGVNITRNISNKHIHDVYNFC